MGNIFYQIKLRNETLSEYVYCYGKVDVTPTTFGHIKKKTIYGQLKQSQVGILKNIVLNIEYITSTDKLLIEKWWESKSTIWIERSDEIPLLCTFVDTDLGLKSEIDTESNEIYYIGTLNFE